MGLLAWSPTQLGCSQHLPGILSLNPKEMLFLLPGTSQLGLAAFPSTQGGVGHAGLQRSAEAAGCWCGLVAAISPGCVAGTAELPGILNEAVHKALMGRACPLQSVLCKIALCLSLVSQLAGFMGSLLMA